MLLDRGTSEAGAVNPTFISANAAAGFTLYRDRTTGHSNLPRSHPMDSEKHSYKFGDFSTTRQGNLWDQRSVNPYLRSYGGPKSEIITLDAVLTMDTALKVTLPRVVWWEFLDWQSGVSEGTVNPDNPAGPPYDLDWYKNTDPNLKDIDEVTPITVGSPIWNAMGAFDFKVNENIRHLRKVLAAGLDIIVNFGGEDWRGLSDLNPKPWLDFPGQDDPDEIKKFTWIYSNLAAGLAPVRTWLDANYPGTKVGIGFLESKEGGDSPPLAAATTLRDVLHIQLGLQYAGDDADALTSSMHYRGAWSRFRTEDKMVLAFCRTTTFSGIEPENQTMLGSATLQEARDWIKWISNHEIGRELDLWPMAQSMPGTITDVEPSEGGKGGTPGIPMTQHERGLARTQFQFELIEAGYTYAAAYVGVSFDHGQAGFSAQAGYMGIPKDDPVYPAVFTLFPEYYTAGLIGQCLIKGTDLIESSVDDDFVKVWTLSWIDHGDEILSVFILNKDSARVVPLSVVGNWGAARCRYAKRFSSAELTAPEIIPPTTEIGALLNVSLVEKSVTYLELVEGNVSQLTELLDPRIAVALGPEPFPIGRQWRQAQELYAAAIGRQPITANIAIGAEVSNVRSISIQFRNFRGVNIDYVESFMLVVFSDATMTALSAGGSTGLAATAGLMQALVAKKIFFCTTTAAGAWTGTWTDTGTDAACIGLQLPGGAWALSAEFANT